MLPSAPNQGSDPNRKKEAPTKPSGVSSIDSSNSSTAVMTATSTSHTSSNKNKLQQQNQGSFPMRLHKMLNQVEKEGLTNIVSWRPHGRAFLVHDRDLFTLHVLPRFFKQTRFPSFQRQLNIYAFGRITRGNDQGAYHHPSFLRGQEDLSLSIQRIQCKNIGKGRHHRPISSEPDFYKAQRDDDQKRPAAAPSRMANPAPVPTQQQKQPTALASNPPPSANLQVLQPQQQTQQQLLQASFASYPFSLMGNFTGAPAAPAPPQAPTLNFNPAAFFGAAQQNSGASSHELTLQALNLLQNAAANSNAGNTNATTTTSATSLNSNVLEGLSGTLAQFQQAASQFQVPASQFQQAAPQFQQPAPVAVSCNNNAAAPQDQSVPLLLQLLLQVMQNNQNNNGNAVAPAPPPPPPPANNNVGGSSDQQLTLQQSALLQGLLSAQLQNSQAQSFQMPQVQTSQAPSFQLQQTSQDTSVRDLVNSLLAEQGLMNSTTSTSEYDPRPLAPSNS